jgi:hypothetical protein
MWRDLTKRGKSELEAAGLSIPFPQRDVDVRNVETDNRAAKALSGGRSMPRCGRARDRLGGFGTARLARDAPFWQLSHTT